MAVFFVHDVGKGIVTPLDRKFRLRGIEPTDELSEAQKIHPKTDTDIEDFKHYSKKNDQHFAKPPAIQQKAISAYQEVKPERSPLGAVRNIMTSPVLSISKNTPLEEAWQIMQQHGIHHLVILDDERKYCGMLSEKKIVPFLMNNNLTDRALLRSTLEPFCNESLLSTTPETQVEDLAPALLEYGLDAIAVSENHIIVGIVTYPDILKTILLREPINTDA